MPGRQELPSTLERSSKDVAKRLGVEGRSRMSKGELLDAIRKANRSRTREAREG